MKYLFLLFSLGIFLSILLLLSTNPVRGADDILISEVQIAGDKAVDEFVELYNPNPEPFDLSGYQLRRKTASATAPATSLKVFGSGTVVPGSSYYLWAATEGIFAPPFADTATGDALASNNSLGLFTKSGAGGVLVDSVSWGKGAAFSPESPTLGNPEKNRSLERNLTSLTWSLADTPTPTNSRGEVYVLSPPAPPPTSVPTDTDGLRINEFLPDPAEDEAEEEFIELYNGSDHDIDLENFVLRDASKTGQYIFPEAVAIKSQSFLILKRPVFKFALNNSKETLSLLDPLGAPVSTVAYEKTKKNVSLNYSAGGWRGSLHLTPGVANVFNNLPETRESMPKKVYEGVAVEFQARGRDADREVLNYVWDFGDGHKSYKEKTTHKFQKKGTYTVTLKTSDSSEDAIETFTIKVRPFPKYDLRIASLLPNPAGKDGESEWIVIRNKEKKDINLRNFSIATGSSSDKLTNHPIREDFTLAGKSEAKITREVALFTLPNKKGRVELRAPDGTVLDKAKYKLEESAEEEMVYYKEKGKEWAWKRDQKTGEANPEPETENTEEEPIDTETLLETEVAPAAEEVPGDSLPILPEEVPEVLNVPPILEGPFITDKKSKDIFSYGTNITLSLEDQYVPKTVHAAASSPSSFETTEEAIAPQYTGQYLSDLNAQINAWLNSR